MNLILIKTSSTLFLLNRLNLHFLNRAIKVNIAILAIERRLPIGRHRLRTKHAANPSEKSSKFLPCLDLQKSVPIHSLYSRVKALSTDKKLLFILKKRIKVPRFSLFIWM